MSGTAWGPCCLRVCTRRILPGTVGGGERPGCGPWTKQGVRVRARRAGLLGQRPWGRTGGADDDRAAEAASDGFAARVYAELAEELPDEDLGEDLDDVLEGFEPGSGPGADAEADEEFLDTVREAHARIARGY